MRERILERGPAAHRLRHDAHVTRTEVIEERLLVPIAIERVGRRLQLDLGAVDRRQVRVDLRRQLTIVLAPVLLVDRRGTCP